MDNFDSSTLDSRWSWIREDPTHWSLTDVPGFLRITTQANPDNLLVQAMPGSDFTMETRVIFTPTESFQIAGLLVYQDDSNTVTLGRAFCGFPPPTCVGNGIYFDYVEGGFFAGHYAVTTTVEGEAYLRIERQGDVYTGSVSTDGTNWALIGAHTIAITPTQIGLLAGNGLQPVGEIPADFDYFTLTDNLLRVYLPLIAR
jgi:beta-xylosidase